MDTNMNERRKKLIKIINDYILNFHWGGNNIPIDMASMEKDDLMQDILDLIEQEVAEGKREAVTKFAEYLGKDENDSVNAEATEYFYYGVIHFLSSELQEEKEGEHGQKQQEGGDV